MTPEDHDCCHSATTPTHVKLSTSDGRRGLWAAMAALASALPASACCWVPLLFLALGVSAGGISATFDNVRPLFLVVAAVLLAVGFYVIYLRKAACAPDADCAAPSPKLGRFNRMILWMATVAVVAFAFFPNYVGFLLADDTSPANVDGLPTVTLDIEGMTCEACAAHIQKSLTGVPGVHGALVSYADGQARVAIDPAAPPSRGALVEAVVKAGYEVR